jgi:hypothetical protein
MKVARRRLASFKGAFHLAPTQTIEEMFLRRAEVCKNQSRDWFWDL